MMIKTMMITWVVLAVVFAVGGARRTLGGGDYTLLNQVLGMLHMDVSMGQMQEIQQKVSFVTVYIRVQPEVQCWNFGVGSVDVGGWFQPPETMGGQSMQRYDLSVAGTGLTLRCRVNLCMKTSLPFNDWDCGGSIDVISEPASRTSMNLTQMVLSPDFGTTLPTVSQALPMSCEEKVDMSGIRFEGRNLKKIMGVDITPFVLKEINGDSKGMALGPIRQGVCDALEGATESINNMVIFNPLSALVNISASPVDPTALERQLPADVRGRLLDLSDNFVTNTLLPTTTTEQGFEAVKIDGDSALVEKVLDLAGMSVLSNTTLVAALWETLVGQPLPTDPAAPLDVLGALRALLGEETVKEFTHLVVASPEVGTVTLDVGALGLSFGSPGSSGDADDSYVFPFLGKQTLGMPAIDFGDLRLHGAFSMDADVSTRLLMDQHVAFKLAQTFEVDFSVQELFLHLAVLLAVDTHELWATEAGPLMEHLMDCVMGFFYKTPEVSEFYSQSKSMDLAVGGFTDAMGVILQDLANAIVPVYRGKLPSALDAYASGFIEGRQLIEPTACPRADAADPALQSLVDFSTGLAKRISDMADVAEVNKVIESVFKEGHAQVISEPTSLLVADLPAIGGLTAQKVSVGVNAVDIGLQTLDELALLQVPPGESAQYLHNGLLTSSFSLGASLTVDSAEARRALAAAGDSPPMSPGDKNTLQVLLAFDSLKAVLDLLAKYTYYDMASMELGKVMIPDCWLARLEPYGGVQQFALALQGLRFNVTCAPCESALVRDAAQALNDGQQQLFDALRGMLDDFLSSLEDDFGADNWEHTMAKANASCLEKSQPADEPKELGSLQSNQEDTYILLGGFAALFLGMGVLVCVPPVRRRVLKAQPAVGVAAPSGGGGDSKASVGELSRSTPLYKHAGIPFWFRAAMPLLIVVNLVLFAVGHTGDVISINFAGQVLGGDIPSPDIGSYSVISSTQELWKGGAYALALLIAVFSIGWPYVKLVLLAFTWFAPTRVLSFSGRSRSLHFIDMVGKWSLVELFVLGFVLVFLNIHIGSPDATLSFLPANLYSFQISIDPAYQMWSFISALLLSLIISAAAAQFQDRIGRTATLLDCKEAPGTLMEEKQPLSRALKDSAVFRWGLFSGLLLSLALLFVALSTQVLRIEIMGLAGVAMEIGGTPKSSEYSFFSFIAYNFEQGVPAGQSFVAFVILVIAGLFPIVQQMFLIVLFAPIKQLNAVTLKQALRLRAFNNLLSTFAAFKVLIIAMCFSVLELGMLTKSLLANQCSAIDPIIKTWLYPLGLISLRDAQASCFALDASLLPGIGWVLAYAVLSNVVYLFARNQINRFIVLRTCPASLAEETPEAPELPPRPTKRDAVNIV